MRPPVLIALKACAFRAEMAGWVRGSGVEPFVTEEGHRAVAFVRERPDAVSFFDRDLGRLGGEEIWRLVRPILGHRLVLMAERSTKEQWFSALADGVGSLLPLPAERVAVLTALWRAGPR